VGQSFHLNLRVVVLDQLALDVDQLNELGGLSLLDGDAVLTDPFA
jgi:hypothetical protein